MAILLTPLPGWSGRTRLAIACGLTPWLPVAAFAQAEPTPTLTHCAQIGAATDRLVCYDKLAGRAPVPTTPKSTENIAAQPSAKPQDSALAATGAPVTLPGGNAASGSLMSRYWELDPSDKRGTFNLVGYEPNYILPLHFNSRINQTPHSPTQATVRQPALQREEVAFQLSVRSKLAQDLPYIGGDLWAAYTQVAFWQLYNGGDSRPFRNTDYQPELTYIRATPLKFQNLPFDIKWRYSQFGIAHQSNGQTDPLSRSWNRVYLGAGFERGDFSLITKWNQRLNENIVSDNNPDLIEKRGRYDFQFNWAHGLQTASVRFRTNFSNTSDGSVKLEYTYPVFRDQPNGLRYYVQVFRGYGETLTDYNFSQTSLGLGVTFLQF